LGALVIRSLLIKVPLVAAAVCAAGFGAGSPAGLLSLALVLLFASLLAWQVFDANAGFWVPTLWRSPRPLRAVALTFDDGPDPDFTPRVLDILRTKDVKAAFFVIGERARRRPEIVARIDAEGHIVGNHSDRHGMSFHFQLWRALRRELDACNDAIRSIIGKEPLLFRSPQGFKNPALGDVVRAMGLAPVGWQVRGFDSVEASAEKIVSRITSRVRAGGVVQMHDGSMFASDRSRRAMLAALPRIIDAIRASGLAFVPLDDLLDVRAYRQSSSGPMSSPESTKKASP
jgi:peptidoglycan/xylan/chitin deacetylase (PgdA/CDA1 family)